MTVFCFAGAFVARDPSNWAKAASALAVLSHVPSALYLNRSPIGYSVLGIRILAFTATIHCYFALHLFANPQSCYYLTKTFMSLNSFAWSRFIYAVYRHFGWFKSDQFGIAMISYTPLCTSLPVSMLAVALTIFTWAQECH